MPSAAAAGEEEPEVDSESEEEAKVAAEEAAAAAELDNDEEEDEEEEAMETLAVLLEDYKVQFWYWEIVEVVRKLLLSAVLSLIDPGSIMQVSAGLLLCALFTTFYTLCRPFATSGANLVTIVLNGVLFMFFFFALMLKVHLLNDTRPIGKFVVALFALAFATPLTPYCVKISHSMLEFS